MTSFVNKRGNKGQKNLKHEPGYLKIGDGKFRGQNPTNFTISDFFKKEKDGYKISMDYINVRCSNLFKDDFLDVRSKVKYVIQEKECLKVYYIVGCGSPRFLTICKLFINHQIEYDIEIDGKRIFFEWDGIEMVDGNELMCRMYAAMVLLSSDTVIMKRIEDLERKKRLLRRVEWMCLFSFCLINKSLCYKMLGIDENGRIYSKLEIIDGGNNEINEVRCNICKNEQSGFRYGPLLYDDGEFIRSFYSEVDFRVFNVDVFFEPIWTQEHKNYKYLKDENYFHHIIEGDEHFHYRRLKDSGLKAVGGDNMEILMNGKEMVFLMLCVYLMKSTVRKFKNGLQYYALYPIDNLFKEIDSDLGVLVCSWMYEFWSVIQVKNNIDDNYYFHFASYCAFLRDEPVHISCIKYFDNDEREVYRQRYWDFVNGRVYHSKDNRKRFLTGKVVFDEFLEELKDRLKVHGCKCEVCRENVFPSL